MNKIIWLIAHEPQYLFVRTAGAFSEALSRLTNNRYDIEVLTVKEYQQKYDQDFEESTDLFDHIRSNKIHMSQTQVHRFSRWDVNYRVFDMPFLFRDHDHATSVFEGDLGKSFGKRLAEKSGMRGLCFTYSGGWRIVGSNKPINSVDELAGLKIRVNGNPVNADFMNFLGASALPMYTYGYDEIDEGLLDAAETTYIRFLGKHILKTNHNMFLTSIVINDEFWRSLSESDQQAFSEAATETARLERQWSIEDAEKFESKCLENSVTITDITEEQKEYLKNTSQGVYDKWKQYFLPGLVHAIKSTH
jgi:TRAP-type C4-dicarboxylate transport system substrate-binding protein